MDNGDSEKNTHLSPDYIALVAQDFRRAMTRSSNVRAAAEVTQRDLARRIPDVPLGELVEALCRDPSWCKTESRDIEQRLGGTGKVRTPKQIQDAVQAVIGERLSIVVCFLRESIDNGDQDTDDIGDENDEDADLVDDSASCGCPAQCDCQGTAIRVSLDLSGTDARPGDSSFPVFHTCAACLDWFGCDNCGGSHCPVNPRCPGPNKQDPGARGEN